MEEKVRLHLQRARQLWNEHDMSSGNRRKALMHAKRASQLKFGVQPCKYGLECRRTNPEHFEKYSHPKGHLFAGCYKPAVSMTSPHGSQSDISFTILAYNMSWQAVSGSNEGSAKALGAICGKSDKDIRGLNICAQRVVRVCANHPYDLILLQEVASKVDDHIVHEMSQKKINYACIRHEDFEDNGAKLSIVHSDRLTPLGSHSGYIGTIDRRGKRIRGPVLAALFLNTEGSFLLAVLNVHAPHHIEPKKLQIQILNALMELCQITQSNEIKHVILAGDFNQKMTNFKAKQTDKWKQLEFNVMNEKLKTGWDTQGIGQRWINGKGEVEGLNYKAVVDNVLCANVKREYVESWYSSELKYLPADDEIPFPLFTSDHAPVAAKVSI